MGGHTFNNSFSITVNAPSGNGFELADTIIDVVRHEFTNLLNEASHEHERRRLS
jgi:hypothetical protein